MRIDSKSQFIAALIVSTVLFSWTSFLLIKEILRYSDYPSINLYAVEPKTFPKVLLIGNSRAGSNFSNSAFAPGDFLNLGRGGRLFDILSLQALDMIDRNPKLKFLVVEPYFLVNENGVGRRAYIEALFSNRMKKHIWGSFSNFEKLTTIFFPSYWLNAPNFLDALVSVFIDRPKRQLSNNARLHLEALDREVIERISVKTYSSISENVIQQLQALKQACEKAGVTLLILASPIHHLHWESVGWKKHISEIKKISSDLTIRFSDFSEILDGEDMFRDTVHLNRVGADLMSDVLFRKTLGNEISP